MDGKDAKDTSDEVRAQIRELAKGILAGEIDVQAACRGVNVLRLELPEDEQADPALQTLMMVDFELDGHPLRSRGLWAPEALAEMDRVKAEFLAKVRDDVAAACRLIVGR